MKTGDGLRRKNSASPSKGCFKRELKPSTQFAYWTAYTHTIYLLPDVVEKKRKIQGTRKTTYGWAQRWGEYCHWRAELSRGMFVENTGHKSPRKQTSLVPLLREQLVCLCNCCTCIYPSSHTDACPRVRVMFSISTVVPCDPVILRKWSQTSKWLKTFWIRDLTVQIVRKILWKVFALHERYKNIPPQALLWHLVHRSCFSIHES